MYGDGQHQIQDINSSGEEEWGQKKVYDIC